jgi:hypothetical protein
MALMATKRRFEQQEASIDHASILRLIEERPAFLGAPDLEALLTRSQTAENLEKAGFPVSSKTLATKASRGGGPPYSLFGPRPLYSWRNALVWAHRRLTPPRRSSSEGDVVGGHEDSNSSLAIPPSESGVQSPPPHIQNDALRNERPDLSARKVRMR